MSALDGKAALVAGGTAGIGLAVAGGFATAGARVVIGGRRPGGGGEAREAGCGFVTLDVSREESFVAALEAAEQQAGRLDVLVLNAGIAQPPTSIGGLDSDAARDVVDTDLLGAFWGLKHGPEHMSDGGS